MNARREDQDVFLAAVYVLAVTLTTAVSGRYGQLASVIDSLPGIGLVIVIRARLQDLWGRQVLSYMLALIFLGSLGTLAANLGHPRIAVASFVAFAAANLAAYATYERSRVLSVLAFAVVDSLVFPSIAFGAFTWWVVAGQIAAKVAGAGLWTIALGRSEALNQRAPKQKHC